MGIRVNTRLGKNTRVSFPLWLVPLPVALLCGAGSLLVHGVTSHPLKALLIVAVWVLLAAVLVPAGFWISRTVDRIQERQDQRRDGR